jgi:regulator of RNase E activity RraA
VSVHPRDLVVADFDGIVVIPRHAVIETVTRAQDKMRRENSSRKDLKSGAYLRDVFAKYGVL